MTDKLFLAPSVKAVGGQRRSDGIKVSLHVADPCDAHGNPLPKSAKRNPDVKRYAVPPRMDGKRPLWNFKVRARVGSPLYNLLRAARRETSETIFAPSWDEANGLAAKVADEWHRTPDPKNIVRTVKDLTEKKLSVSGGKMRPATIAILRQRYGQFVIPAFGAHRDIRTITSDDMDGFIKKFANKGAMQTRQLRIDTWSSLFNFAITYHWLDESPMLPHMRINVMKVGERKGGERGDARVARALTLDEDIPKIIAELEQDDIALVMLLLFMAWTGARAREALHVRTSDFKFAADGSAFVTIASDFFCNCEHCFRNNGERLTKNGKPRLVPLHPSLTVPMQEYLAQHAAHFKDRQPTEWAFPMWRRRGSSHAAIGGIRNAHTLRVAFQAAAARVAEKATTDEEREKFTGLVVHDLRSSAKTAWLLWGAEPVAADCAFGHAIRGSAMNDTYAQFQQTPTKYYAACFPPWQPKLVLSSGGANQTGAKRIA